MTGGCFRVGIDDAPLALFVASKIDRHEHQPWCRAVLDTVKRSQKCWIVEHQ